MPYFKSLLAIAFVCFAVCLNAQSSASLDNNEILLEDITINSSDSEDWTFYLDAESKTYFIDFETISVNLNDVKVYNESGEIVMKDNLWNLPVNTIYELNLAEFAAGEYTIELRTFTGKIVKEVTIAE